MSAGLAAAEPVVFLSPRAGETLQGGQVVEVRFDGVPDGAEEMELLLIAGSSRSISFRLTEMLDPLTRSFSWTVPNLVLPQASLVLRVGEDEHELECEPSDAFAIEPSRSSAVARLDFRHGELWVSDAGIEATASYTLPGMAMMPSHELIRHRRGRKGVLVPNPPPSDPALTDYRLTAPIGADSDWLFSQPGPRSRVPRDVPRRI